ncbi:glutamate receptor 3-like [Styela clava]
MPDTFAIVSSLLSLLFILTVCVGQEYSSTGRQTVSLPVGTIFPKSIPEVESVFKFVLRNYNSRALSTGNVFGFNSPVLRFQAYLQNAQPNDSYGLVKEFCNHITQEAFAVLGRFEQNTKNVAKRYSESFNIPWISTGTTLPDQSEYITSLYPPLSPALLSLTNKWNCKHITYFYDITEIHLGLNQLLDYSLEYKFSVKVRNMKGNQNILPHLREIATSEEHVIVFDVTKKLSIAILNQLDSIGMLTPEYQYIFTDLALAEEDLIRYTTAGANITLFSITNKQTREFQTFLINYKKTTGLSSITYEGALIYDAFKLLYIGMKSMLNDGYPAQNFVKGNLNKRRCRELPSKAFQTGMDINQALKKTKFQGVTGQVQFDKYGQRVNYTIRILSVERTGIQSTGYWKHDITSNKTLGFIYLNRTLDHDKILQKYMNQTIIVTTILEEPYVSLKKEWKSFQGNEKYEGFCVDLLNEISKIVPMQYKLRPVLDGQYGSKNEETGIWNGMIGEVKYNVAHMAVAPLTITSAREAVVDFTKPFMSLGISIMIKKPEKEKPHIFSFLEPLAPEIWICIVFAYIGVSVVIFIISRFSPYEWHRASVLRTNDEEEIEKSADFGIFNSFWFSLGAIMQQGADISPKSFSGRLVGGVWWFFTLIIVSSYTANLAAFLTVERMGTTIKGAEDLASQTEIQYGTLASGSTASFFKNTPIALYEKMWNYMKNKEPSVFVKNNKEGIDRVRNSDGKYAFLMESTQNDYMAQRKPCNTMKVGSNIDNKGYGIALPKGSPIYDSINLAILILQERGNLQKLKKFWWYDKSQCTDAAQSKSDKTSELGLANVAGVFYVLLGGIVFALFVALLEYAYKVAKLTANKKNKLKAKCNNCMHLLTRSASSKSFASERSTS